jgi:tRNA 2-thiouridine synthesizing protein A
VRLARLRDGLDEIRLRTFVIGGNLCRSWGNQRIRQGYWSVRAILPRRRRKMADKELDARGLNCPLPILRAKKALNELKSGQTLHILATDPGSVKDFEAFAKQTGNQLLESKEANGEYSFLLKKG